MNKYVPPEFEKVEEMVVSLHQTGKINIAERPEDFTRLKSGRMSPHLVNLRGLGSIDYGNETRVTSIKTFMRARELAALGLTHTISHKTERYFQHIVGLPEAMTLFCGYVAAKGNYSALFMRVGDKKDYGIHERIEGSWYEGDRVVPLDDAITTSGAKLEHIPILESAGLEVDEVAVLVDREEGGTQTLEDAGYRVMATVGMSTVNEILHEQGRITDAQHGFVTEYLDQYRES